jgi:inosine/xanthosine triphosphatase
MKIAIGSRSNPKLIAITRAFGRFPELWMEKNEDIEYIVIPEQKRNDQYNKSNEDSFSGVKTCPLNLEETLQGAKNRAKKAYGYVMEQEKECDYAVGIEGGMFPELFDNEKTMGGSICAIFDGKNYFIGFSPLFEYPQSVVKRATEGEEIGYMQDIFGDTAKGRKRSNRNINKRENVQRRV